MPVAEDEELDGLSGLAAITAVTVLRPMARERAQPVTASGRLRMLVIGDSIFATPSLPDDGVVTIGRSRKTDVCVDDSQISRHHATLRTGENITIQDEGSANGTTVRGQRIPPHQPVRVQIGDLVTCGNTNFIVQRRAAEVRPRRLWTHDYFETRVEDECARAARAGTTFAVLGIHLLGEASPALVQEALAELVRQSDIVGTYGARAYEVLLVDTAPAMAEQIAGRLASSLAEHGVKNRVVAACYPRDGKSAHALIHKLTGAGDAAGAEATPDGIVVVDGAMLGLYAMIDKIAASNINVLILGETGVGKDVFAAAVHRSSPRASGPFVQLNCASLSETLLESELFGHEKGAFTGAVATKVGLLEAANGGTVLLDEIGDMPLSLQAKLLRVIEERQVRRLGSVKPRPIDVRFLAATNRDLELEEARFRRDLFFRLNGVTILIPPLRERVADIEPLAQSFAARAAASGGQPPPELAPEALALLRGYAWPGNVRELRNVIERAVLLSEGAPIGPEHLPAEKMGATIVAQVERRPRASSSPVKGEGEMQRIISALEQARGNQTKAAELLGISRRTLINRLDEYGFARPRKKKRPE